MKTSPAAGKAKYAMPALVLGTVPLLLANWFISASFLGRDCILLYEGGNITECGGGLSEEQMAAAAGLVAMAMLALQIGLIVLVSRRTRPGRSIG